MDLKIVSLPRLLEFTLLGLDHFSGKEKSKHFI